MKAGMEQTATRVYIRANAKRYLGPNGTPLQYISLLAHAWECAPHEAIERIRARIRRVLTDGNPGEAR